MTLKPTPGLRNPEMGHKLSLVEFKELILLMRSWPMNQQAMGGRLLRHVWYLQAEVDKLEEKVRQMKIDAGALHDPPTKYFKAGEEIAEYHSRGSLAYEILSQGLEAAERMARWSGKTVQVVIDEANQWADQNGKPRIHEPETNPG